MKLKNILITMIVIFALVSLFIYIDPSVTGFAVQDRFMISDVKVSSPEFEQQVRVEQFDDYKIKFKDALYYFVVEPEYEQEINYLEIEFMVDSQENIGLYYYNDGWKELEVEFVKEFGRFNYYKGKGEEFGLFAVAGKERKEEIIAPVVSKNDLLMFGLLPIFVIILLFSVLSFGFVILIQKFSYRFYLVLKRIFVELTKFGLSFGIVILILDLISVEQVGSVSRINLIYYAVIPVLVLSLLSDAILSLILWLHRLIMYSRVYKFVRNSSLLFVIVLAGIFAGLYKFVPVKQGELAGNEIILFGLVPVVLISFVVVFVFYGFYVLVRRVARV